MKFGRKSKTDAAEPEVTETDAAEATAGTAGDDESGAEPVAEDAPVDGPYDISEVDVDNDGVVRVDLGGLLIAPSEGHELRLQVDEATQEVQSVMVAGDDGAVELRAFAAPRNGDLWSDVRRQIASETSRAGGTATEREGRWGTELECQVQVRTPEGRSGTQPSRIVGINGNRWFLRATYLGRPAVNPERAADFEDVVASVVVRRGDAAMAPGDPLPVELPTNARRIT
ncbi:MAG: DUF3710 domain-containing protein [Nocardioides sp.]